MSHVTSNQPEGTPNWLDLGIPDMNRAKEFYGRVLGWEFQDLGAEAGGYHFCLLRGEPVAGIMQNPDESATEFWWNVYFATDDCDGVVKRVGDAGGRVLMEPMDVMDQGRMAMVADSVGAQFGFWQGRAMNGSRLVNEPGALVWNELVTPDADEAREFYRAVFEYTTEPVAGDLDYSLLRRPDGHEIGGIFGDPDARSSSWLTYFQVEDVDAALRAVQSAGGTVEGEPWNTPYGRMAHVTDPFGVEFRLVRPPEEAPQSI
jgi:predicted enzyme related to lactoylglutathione lyase